MLFLNKLFGRGKPAFVPELSDRAESDVARDLTPQKVDAIMRAANSGDIADQCRLARELIEHNPDIAHAIATRSEAVLGCRWEITAGDDSEPAKIAAKALQSDLAQINGASGFDTFEDLLEDLTGALLPGFAVSEILWHSGGRIAGFNHIAQHHFTLADGFYPRLITRDDPRGMVIPGNRILYHRLRTHGSDPARGGLIRPLAWLHCFANINDKQLLAFIDRYGMPFLTVKVDDETYKRERHNLKAMIRNFGSSGGGLFSRNAEPSFLQAPNADGNIYFRLKQSLSDAVCKIILGQTASSGDGGGLSGDNAQSKVRQDILESDCRRIMRTINAQLCIPFARYNFGDHVAPPVFSLDYTAPEDKLAKAQMLQALAGAGWAAADAKEMSDKFGFELEKQAAAEYGQFGQDGQAGQIGRFETGGVAAMSAEDNEPGLARALNEWLGPIADQAGVIASLSDDDFDQAMRSGIAPEPGDADQFDALLEQDMTRQYREGLGDGA